MKRFVLNHKFINISIQKSGIPGFPGCIEHASMLWDWIKVAWDNKSAELHVIWLDLENAYGSIRHPLIEKSMDFFWIPEDIWKLISGYYKCTYMRFSNAKYFTNWPKLNVGIMMRCIISPLIFVLVMEMLLRSTKDTTRKKTVPSMKNFMNDVTVISESKSHMEKLLKRLQELLKWAVMKIKPSKSCNLSIIQGRCQKIKFAIDNNVIPTIRKKSVKSFGRGYSLPLTDCHRRQDHFKQLNW